ncbi:hypothetical protein Bca52824_033183 [Brassica carinata]|uniref:Uncharacterized protein n=1 Tax=Brassica carinata TaxID=52824 RepID=A0A8X7V721_BRACI|nr:hypothetical protein Bca52824_033183 [Brassica carinata]
MTSVKDLGKRTGGEPEEARSKDGEEFSQWDSEATQRKHGAILQILVDGRKEGHSSSTNVGVRRDLSIIITSRLDP